MYNVRKRLVVKNRVRFTIFIVISVAIFNMLMFAFITPEKTNADVSHKTQSVCVGAGDTLWEIAKTYCDENSDVRELVYRIKKINNMKTADLAVGQMIEVPLN